MKRLLNAKTLGVAVVAVIAVVAVYPDAVVLLPFLLFAACPLMMIFMMRGHGGHAGHEMPSASRAALGEYVCPMHAEARSTFPGRCPLCGMDLKTTTRASSRGD